MKYLKTISTIIITIIILGIANTSFAVEKVDIEEYLKEKNMNVNNISASDALTIYQDLSKEYSNEEIAEMIDDYSPELKQKGISENTLSAGKTLLEQTDAKTLNEVFEEVNVEEIKEKLEQGYSAEEILNDIKNEMPTQKKVSVASKIILSNKIVKTVIIISLIYGIYAIIIRGLIYIKAREHFWATFIPFYRDAVLFKICGYSAWWLILLLIPIIGWFIYGVLKLVMNFELSKAFGKGFFFGLGIWLLKPIFETIIVFNKKIQFLELED